MNTLTVYRTTCTPLWSYTLPLCPPQNRVFISWKSAVVPGVHSPLGGVFYPFRCCAGVHNHFGIYVWPYANTGFRMLIWGPLSSPFCQTTSQQLSLHSLFLSPTKGSVRTLSLAAAVFGVLAPRTIPVAYSPAVCQGPVRVNAHINRPLCISFGVPPIAVITTVVVHFDWGG